jgi:hypothetical protein
VSNPNQNKKIKEHEHEKFQTHIAITDCFDNSGADYDCTCNKVTRTIREPANLNILGLGTQHETGELEIIHSQLIFTGIHFLL